MLWKQLVDEAGEEAIARAAAVTVAEAERDRVRSGLRAFVIATPHNPRDRRPSD
jgi:hypothetical protein